MNAGFKHAAESLNVLEFNYVLGCSWRWWQTFGMNPEYNIESITWYFGINMLNAPLKMFLMVLESGDQLLLWTLIEWMIGLNPNKIWCHIWTGTDYSDFIVLGCSIASTAALNQAVLAFSWRCWVDIEWVDTKDIEYRYLKSLTRMEFEPTASYREGRWSTHSAIPSFWDDVCLLWSYFLATSKVISGMHQLVLLHTHGDFINAAPLGDQATGTMTRLPIQWHYSDTELSSPCFILVMSSIKLGSEKYQFCKSLL